MKRSIVPQSLLACVLVLAVAPVAIGTVVLSGITSDAPDELLALGAATTAVETGTTPDPGDTACREEALSQRSLGWYHAAVGSAFVHDAKISLVFTLRGKGKAIDPGKAARLGYRYRMSTTIAARDESAILTRVRFSNVEVSSPGLNDQEIAKVEKIRAQQAAAKTETYVKRGLDGKIEGYRFADGLDAGQRNFVRTLIGTFSFTVPADTEKPWESSESDATGEFRARYLRSRLVDGVLHVERRKLRYTAFTTDARETPEHSVSGMARAVLDTKLGWLVSAEIDEGLKMEFELIRGELDGRLKARLKLLEFRRVSDPVAGAYALLGSDTWGRANAAGELVKNDSEARDAVAKELEGVSLESLIDELRTLLAAGKGGSREEYLLWDKLGKLVHLDSKVAGSIESLVRSGQVSDALNALLLTALGAAGTEAAQAALLGVYRDPSLKPATRETTIVAMHQLQSPTPELVETVCQRALAMQGPSDLDGANLLLLGTLASRNGRTVAGRPSMGVLLGLEPRMHMARTTETWLDALGNTGSPEVLPQVRHYLDAPSDRVRLAAVYALRDIPENTVVPLLTKMGRRDRSPEVRQSAVEALSHQGTAPAQAAIRNIAATDRSPRVRRVAILAMARHPSPANNDTLLRISQGDRSSDLRALAQRILSRSRS